MVCSQDSGWGFWGAGLWSRAPLSISQNIIKMHIEKLGHIIHIVGAG